ncbi:hypothetical protein DdX_14348 [Ditylenchus destructor]|uniref:Uncharacterized protein n=1 Tax=Ditylenchus destructor TaxID=166010 RepID=A0AAD4MXB8_9BILA|nr:hypothetical protein DdX_14348 [Ditylenchus destructor]
MLTIALILFFATTLPTADLEFIHRVLGVNNGIVGVNISTLLTKYKDANFAPFQGSCRWHNQALTPFFCKPQCPNNLQTDYDPNVEGFWTASTHYRNTFGWSCYYGKKRLCCDMPKPVQDAFLWAGNYRDLREDSRVTCDFHPNGRCGEIKCHLYKFWDERNDRFWVISEEAMIFGENCDRIEIFTYKARAHRNHTLGLIKFWDRDESEVESVWIKVAQF